MGSPDGAWNPEPDEQITGALRHDVDLSPNHSRFIAYVKACCIRKKAADRTALGITERGKPLTLARIIEYFDWDSGNASRLAKQLLAWGFVRINENGVFGLGACVRGTFVEDEEGAKTECSKCGRKLGEFQKCAVCTYSIPEYVFVAIKRLSEIEQKNFIQGWVSKKERELERIAESTKTIRQETKADLNILCRQFGIELKTEEQPADKNGSKKGRKKGGNRNPQLFVQTASDDLSAQTAKETVYNVAADDVQTEIAPPFLKTERKGKLASDPSEENQLAETLAANVRRACRRLPKLEGLTLDEPTVQRMVQALLTLEISGDRRKTFEALDKACYVIWKNHQSEIDQTGNTDSYGWGYVVRVVQSEVDKRAEVTDIHAKLKAFAAKMGGPR
jgi:hypothetical protein